jgi:2-polyprenyl-3-methyl-5-hydroxy-6-metoxy-1,4-benzoquinol methylase
MNFPKYSQVPTKGRLRICLSLVKKERLRNKDLVDIGCSSGWLLFKLEKSKLKKRIGVDPSRKAIKFAQRHTQGVDFFVSGAEKLPLEGGSADFVTMFDVIEHVPKNQEAQALKEAARILKRDGKLFLSTPNFHPAVNFFDPAWYLGHRHYKPEQIKKLVEEAGFEVLSLEIKGGIWSIIYMLWFYLVKWVFGKTLPRNKWLEEKDDRDYSKPGFFAIFLVAQKN